MKRGQVVGTSLLAAACLAALGTAMAPAASATPADPYVLVAWQINTPGYVEGGEVWGGGGQTNPIPLYTSSTNLDLIKPFVPCGTWVQIDLYDNSQITADLLAGGILRGSHDPNEDEADVSPWYIPSWYSGDCKERPTPRPYSLSRDDFTCETVTEYRAEGFFDLDFDRIANVWTERTTPTLTSEIGAVRATTAAERAEHPECLIPESTPTPTPVPELAETAARVSPVAVVFGIAALLLGGVAVWATSRYAKRVKDGK